MGKGVGRGSSGWSGAWQQLGLLLPVCPGTASAPRSMSKRLERHTAWNCKPLSWGTSIKNTKSTSFPHLSLVRVHADSRNADPKGRRWHPLSHTMLGSADSLVSGCHTGVSCQPHPPPQNKTTTTTTKETNGTQVKKGGKKTEQNKTNNEWQQ